MEPTQPAVTNTAAPSASSTNQEVVAEQAAVVEKVSDDAALVETPAPVETVAVVEQVAAPAFDPMAVAQANPMLAFALAALAVVGGGAGWKFWSKLSEQKHEQKMKELELQAQKVAAGGSPDLEKRIEQLESSMKRLGVKPK